MIYEIKGSHRILKCVNLIEKKRKHVISSSLSKSISFCLLNSVFQRLLKILKHVRNTDKKNIVIP